MIKHLPGSILEITAQDRETIDNDLDTAVELARVHAMEQGHGILVLQHGYSNYTVAVSREVPYGQTRERRQWTDLS